MPDGTVLVVDDSRLSRLLAKKHLEALGFAVTEAANGAEALALLEGGARADVAIVDRNMPEMDGPELVLEIRRREGIRDMKLVLASAAEPAEVAAEAESVGTDAFLQKPWTAEQLANVLAELLP